MPWKNGGGKTLELATSQQRHSDDQLPLWRLSIADVASDGPFSVFPHYQRHIMLLQGAGMALSFNHQAPVLIDKRLQIQPFLGAWQTDCRLIAGAIKDFNLMVDARLAASAAQVACGQFSLPSPKSSDIMLIYVIQGSVQITRAATDSTTLMAHHCAELAQFSQQSLQIQGLSDDCQCFIANLSFNNRP